MIAASRWLLPLALVCFALPLRAQDPVAGAPSPAAASPPPPRFTWSQCHVDGPYIAITFDDGPSATLTPKLLDLLKEKHIHATFFLIGENAKAHPDIVKRAFAEGHEIGNHSWNHPQLNKKSDEDVRSQVTRTNEAIAAAIGKTPTLMRPPFGALTALQRAWLHQEFGFQIILWDVDPEDWHDPGPAVVKDRILNGWKSSAGVRNGSIILTHDIHAGTVQAMPETLDALLDKGFKFVTVSELLAMHKEPPPKPVVPKAVGSTARPAASPRATIDPSLPKTINGSSN